MASVMLAMTLLFFGGLPLGLPPAEPDPIIAKVAPENGLVFVAWTGRAKPDPKSTNQFEQLLAEEEVRKFGAEVCRVLTVLIEKQVEKSGPQAKSLYDDLRPLVTTALTHSTSIYVSKFVPPVGPEVKPDLRGGMVVELGDQAEKTRALVEKYSAMIPPDVAYSVDVDGQKWHGVRTPADAGSVPIVFGVKEHYLVVGVGEGEVEAMLKRAQGNPPAWLAES